MYSYKGEFVNVSMMKLKVMGCVGFNGFVEICSRSCGAVAPCSGSHFGLNLSLSL